jgi:DNA-binding transcriptional MerR regulator
MQIPDDKKYFRIGEVSRIIGVRPYVLRYWES